MLKAVSWRHAIGEIFLIVAGILIALALSDWNDRRLQREEEFALLSEVRYTLQTDVEILESNLRLFTEAASRMKTLLALLETDSAYVPYMDQLFGAVYGLRITNLNSAAYETLKSVGMQSVSNQELRTGIARVFDHYYERIAGEKEVEFQVTFVVMRPYYLEHFRKLDFLNSATPIDPEAVMTDPYFENIVEYRLTVLTGNQLDSYALAIKEMRRVLELLEGELS